MRRLVDLPSVAVGGELTRKELGAVTDIAAETAWTQLPGAEVAFFRAVAALVSSAKTELHDVVELLLETKGHDGPKVVVLRSPLGVVPPTPISYPTARTQLPMVVDVLRAVLISLIGWYPYGFRSQEGGAIHNDVISVPEAEGVPNHSGTQEYEIALHTEDASFNLGDGFDISPDFLTLQFLRNPDRVPTIVATPDWSRLGAEVVDVLRSDWFSNRTAPLQGGSANDPEVSVAIVYGSERDPWFRINMGRLESERYVGRQRDALLAFQSHLEDRRMPLPAHPGDIVVIDNRRVAHARPAGPRRRAFYDGTDRWQRRVVVSDEPARVQRFEVEPHIADPRRLLRSIHSGP